MLQILKQRLTINQRGDIMFKIIILGIILWFSPEIFAALQIIFFEDIINLIMGVSR